MNLHLDLFFLNAKYFSWSNKYSFAWNHVSLKIRATIKTLELVFFQEKTEGYSKRFRIFRLHRYLSCIINHKFLHVDVIIKIYQIGFCFFLGCNTSLLHPKALQLLMCEMTHLTFEFWGWDGREEAKEVVWCWVGLMESFFLSTNLWRDDSVMSHKLQVHTLMSVNWWWRFLLQPILDHFSHIPHIADCSASPQKEANGALPRTDVLMSSSIGRGFAVVLQHGDLKTDSGKSRFLLKMDHVQVSF